MPVTIEYDDDIMVAMLEGELDHHTAREIRERIDSEAIRRKPKTIILDFGAVSFMDSSGIGLIMGRFRLQKEMGGGVEIANTPQSISKMIRLSGLGRLGIKGA